MVNAGKYACLAFLTVAVNLSAQPESQGTVTAAYKDPNSEWKDYPTRTLDNLPEAIRKNVDSGLTPFGGQLSLESKATGFFHTTKINGRWWLVDPDGGLALHKGVAGVAPLGTGSARGLLSK